MPQFVKIGNTYVNPEKITAFEQDDKNVIIWLTDGTYLTIRNINADEVFKLIEDLYYAPLNTKDSFGH
jgi:hypothetical protein